MAESQDAPLGRDDFVKRRQEAREAGDGTPTPDDGGETSPLEEAIEGEAEVVQEEPQGAPEPTETDPLVEIFGDELGVEEPSTLTGLEPPAQLNATEQKAFEEASPELQAIISRVSKAASDKVRESGESLASRNKEIADRQAALDQALIEAKAVLDVPIDDLPFTPPHSEAKLDQLLDEGDELGYNRAKRENERAMKDHQAAVSDLKAEREKQKADIDKQLKERQTELAQKFQTELLDRFPAWKDPEVMKAQASEASAYMVTKGYSEAEIKQIGDARLVDVIVDGMKYRKALELARNRRQGKAKTVNPPPAQGRSRQSNTAEVDRASKRFREKPTADSFAARRAAQRAAQSGSRRRV